MNMEEINNRCEDVVNDSEDVNVTNGAQAEATVISEENPATGDSSNEGQIETDSTHRGSRSTNCVNFMKLLMAEVGEDVASGIVKQLQEYGFASSILESFASSLELHADSTINFTPQQLLTHTQHLMDRPAPSVTCIFKQPLMIRLKSNPNDGEADAAMPLRESMAHIPDFVDDPAQGIYEVDLDDVDTILIEKEFFIEGNELQLNYTDGMSILCENFEISSGSSSNRLHEHLPSAIASVVKNGTSKGLQIIDWTPADAAVRVKLRSIHEITRIITANSDYCNNWQQLFDAYKEIHNNYTAFSWDGFCGPSLLKHVHERDSSEVDNVVLVRLSEHCIGGGIFDEAATISNDRITFTVAMKPNDHGSDDLEVDGSIISDSTNPKSEESSISPKKLSRTQRRKLAVQEAQQRADELQNSKPKDFSGKSSGERRGSSGALVGRAVEIHHKAEEESQARIEKMRKEKLEDYKNSVAAASLGEGLQGDEKGGHLALSSRAEEIRKKAEEEQQKKLQQMKREKEAEFAAAKSSVTADAVPLVEGMDPEEYSKLSLAQKQKLIQQQQERDRLAKLEQIKQEKLKEFLTPKEKSKVAKKSNELDDILSDVRQVDGEYVDDDDEDDEERMLSKLTLSERQELAKKRAEEEKKRRLQEFLRVEDSQNSDDRTVGADGIEICERGAVDSNAEISKLSVKERFARAKLEEQKAQEERLARVRNHRVDGSGSKSKSRSVTDLWEAAIHESHSSSAQSLAHTDQRAMMSRSSTKLLNSTWEEALSESKAVEENRMHRTKENTISQFRITDGTGIVRKRIDEWEELFMLIAATTEQLEATLHAAHTLSKHANPHSIDELARLQKEFRDSSNEPEVFALGSTKIYSSKVLDRSLASYLRTSLSGSGGTRKHVSFSCGVYGDHSGKPPIDVFAAAIRTDDDSIYIAVTIKASEGRDDDIDVFGLKKVAVFSKELDQQLFERIYDIVPESACYEWADSSEWEEREYSATSVSDFQDAHDGIGRLHIMNNQGEILHNSLLNRGYSSEVEKVTGSSQDVLNTTADSQTSEDVGEGTWISEASASASLVSSPIPPVAVDYQYSPQSNNKDLQFIKGTDLFPASDSSAERNNETISGDDEPPSSLLMSDIDRHNQHISMRAAAKNRIPSIADGDDEGLDDEDIDEDDEDDFNYTAFSAANPARVAHLEAPRAYPPEPMPIGSKSKKIDSKHYWSVADEASTGLPKANHAKVAMDIHNVRTHYCCGNMMVVEEEGQRSTVITGTLKSASTPTKYILVDGMIFEWVKGASASGWLIKWPMQSQNFGRRMRRFFVLRDSVLSYHITRPKTEEDVYSNYSLSSLILTENSTVQIGRRYFLRSMIVTTPIDKLWVRMKNGAGEEKKWVAEITKAIQDQSRKKLCITRTRVESRWYHESSDFSIIAVDAVSSSAAGEQFVKAGLFCLRSIRSTHSMTQEKSSQRTTDENNSFPLHSQSGCFYSIDACSSLSGRTQLELLRSNEHWDLKTQLRTLKLFGDKVLIGGTNGYLAVGSVSLTPGYTDSNPRPCVYCTPICQAHDPILSDVNITVTSAVTTSTPFALHEISLDDDDNDNLDDHKVGDGDVDYQSQRSQEIDVGESGISRRNSSSSKAPNADHGGGIRNTSTTETQTPSVSRWQRIRNSFSGNPAPISTSAEPSATTLTLQTPAKSTSNDIAGKSSTVRRSGSMSSSASSEQGLGYPHRRQSSIVCIGVSPNSNTFIAADDEGVLSFWYMPCESTIDAFGARLEEVINARNETKTSIEGSADSESAGKHSSSRKIHEKFKKPELKSLFQLSSIDQYGHYAGELVNEIHFLKNDTELIVSTNKRLLLLVVGPVEASSITHHSPSTPISNSSSSGEQRTGYFNGDVATPFAASTPGAGSSDSPDTAIGVRIPNSPTSPNTEASNQKATGRDHSSKTGENSSSITSQSGGIKVTGWVEIDRTIPGKVGIFAMHDSEVYVPTAPGAATAELRRTFTQWRIVEEDNGVISYENDGLKRKENSGGFFSRRNNSLKSSSNEEGATVGDDGRGSVSAGSSGLRNKCVVYRFEWTEDMFKAVLAKVKPIG